MRPNDGTTDRWEEPVAAPSRLARARILDRTAIPVAWKIGYVLNFYREPSFRAIEAEFGLTRPEIVTLIYLSVEDGITASEICEFSGHLKANVSRAVIALQRKGLIRRMRDAADSRRQLLGLAPEGRALFDRFIPQLQQRERAMLSCLTARERRTLDALLHKLADHVPTWAATSEL